MDRKSRWEMKRGHSYSMSVSSSPYSMDFSPLSDQVFPPSPISAPPDPQTNKEFYNLSVDLSSTSTRTTFYITDSNAPEAGEWTDTLAVLHSPTCQSGTFPFELKSPPVVPSESVVPLEGVEPSIGSRPFCQLNYKGNPSLLVYPTNQQHRRASTP